MTVDCHERIRKRIVEDNQNKRLGELILRNIERLLEKGSKWMEGIFLQWIYIRTALKCFRIHK